MSLTRSIWMLVIFQVFFIVALYVLLLSRTQQRNLNVNIISVQKSRRSSRFVSTTAGDSPSQQSQNQELAASQLSSESHATNFITKISTSTIVMRSTELSAVSNSTTTVTTVASNRLTTFLLIMVPILPSSFRSRELIRSTWYKTFTDGEDVVLRFAMGIKDLDDNVTKQLINESNTYADLIFFENFKENKSVLTNKTLMLMQWAHANVNFTYFLKCDDDTYVFINRMLKELRKRPTTKRLYYGVIDTKGRPKKNEDAIWPDLEWDLADTYLPYALGGGYILSSDLVGLIVEDSEYLRWHPNEDTAVGSWLAPYKYERRKDKLICIMFFTKKKSRKCPQYHIMHLFFGVSREELEKTFIAYSKLDT